MARSAPRRLRRRLRRRSSSKPRRRIRKRSRRRRSSSRRKRSRSSSASRGGVAVKLNPRLWERAKRSACSQGKLCKHSARKMQWATSYYKSHGGKYRGKKSSSNRLVRWGRQKWRTSSGKKSGGKLRYLPDRAWKALSPAQKRSANATKQRGYSKGKQYVRNPRDVARISKRYRG